MLTLDAILATTRQQAAYGELRGAPVPRDRHAAPRIGGADHAAGTTKIHRDPALDSKADGE